MILIIFLGALVLLYLLAIAFLYRGFARLARQARSASQPKISVVVCAHNEEKNLPNCLRHLSQQSYPQKLVEFIIVNDRSTDRTQEIIDQFKKKDVRFRSITIRDRLPDFAPKKRAIDAAIRQANGEIILLTDADGRPGPHWIATMASYFTPETHMVLGYAPYTIRPANHFVKKLLALEYLSHAAVAAASTGLNMPLTCVGTNMAYRKQLYLEIGGFGEYKAHLSGDDDLFLTRVREAKKYTIKYATDAEAQVFNNPPQLWSKFLHQRMRYASKGFDYPLKVTLGLVSYYLMNALLVGLTFFFVLVPPFPLALLGIWGIKIFAEFLFMDKAASVLHDRRTLQVFPVAALVHPLYVVVFGAIGPFKRFRWAESHVEAAVQKPAMSKE